MQPYSTQKPNSFLTQTACLNFIADSFINSMQLVFVAFTGEAWGYLGSRRFLVELDMHSDAVQGLNHSLIETVF